METAVIEHLFEVSDCDACEICEIERECFGDEAWSAESIRSFLSGERVMVIAARVGGKIIGMACAATICGETEIMKVAVLDRYRRKGIGGGILRRLIDDCSSLGTDRFLLEVREGNDGARRLYESIGFTEYGRRHAYYSTPREDAVLMEMNVKKD